MQWKYYLLNLNHHPNPYATAIHGWPQTKIVGAAVALVIRNIWIFGNLIAHVKICYAKRNIDIQIYFFTEEIM